MLTKWFNIKEKTQAVGFLLTLCCSLTLAGCAGHSAHVASPASAPMATVEDKRAYYISQLTRNGAQVIHVGEEIRIILRDDYLFNPDSANLRGNANPVLTWAASLIKTYTTVSIQVAGYLDDQSQVAYSQALSTRQAQVIADSLWDKGIDTRLLYVVGKNQAAPVDWNGSFSGQSFNRRVEISFRYYPSFKGYE